MRFKAGQLIESTREGSRGVVLKVSPGLRCPQVRYILFHIPEETYHIGRIFSEPSDVMSHYYRVIK